jgi:uncharacterized membrane protein YkvA (DUF1232 family)
VRGLLSILARLPQYIRLSWRLLWDSRVPLRHKLLVFAAVAYGISPLDFIPEAFVPHFGLGEDAGIILLSLWYLIRKSPPEIVTEHARNIAEGSKGEGET